MFFSILAFILGNLPDLLKNSLFELLYIFYLLKFKDEKDYISERLKKANLQIKPKDIYINLFLNGLDSLKFLQNKKIPVKFENLHLAKTIISDCRYPVVFVGIHLGAFEMLHRVIAQILETQEKKCEKKINLIVSEFRNKNLDKYLTNLRKTQNMRIVKDYEISKILKKAIRNKEILAVMADQAKQGTEYFEILGGSVPLFLKLPLMLNRLGASVIFFRTFRKNGEHIIKFESAYEPNSKINPAEIAKMFEGWILEYPEQWAWNYSERYLVGDFTL